MRALRRARGLTLQALAARLGMSVGWLSQVERDISTPQISDLQAIAKVFEVPLSLFFGSAQAPDNEQGLIVRAGQGRAMGSDADGLIETLLSPDLTDDFEVIHSTFLPGAIMQDANRRDTQELGYLISGKLDLWIDERPFTITAGDSFRIRESSYRWSNPYDVPAIAVWVISPPVY